MERAEILIVDDEPGICEALQIVLADEGHQTTLAHSGDDAVVRLGEEFYDLVITDIRMEGTDGFGVLRKVLEASPQTAVIMITSFATVESAVEAMKQGATDYITKPFLNDEIRVSVQRALERRKIERENVVLKRQVSGGRSFEDMVGSSAPMLEVFEMIERIAPTNSNVLITGESGTGKGLVARAIHARSRWAEGPLVVVNCGAIPENLLESELFGHTRGAFTSAYASKDGLFKMADGGTLFLDEITEIPPHLQVKLLHAIQDKEFVPTGATRTVRVNARVVAASNSNIEAVVQSGRFREDLYYRLNVFELTVPPLRLRKDDIPMMVEFFVRRFAAEQERELVGVEPRVLRVLLDYEWPGNVRELENVLERAVALAQDSVIRERDLPGRLLQVTPGGSNGATSPSLKDQVASFEKRVILNTLIEHEYDKVASAEALGVNLTTLYRKFERLELDPRELRKR